MRLRTEREADLARPLVDWLAVQGWDVWQEVRIYASGPRADIAAKQGRMTWVIEVKTAASWSLFDQAMRWKGYANFVSVAFPQIRGGLPMSLRAMAKAEGLGVITLCDLSPRADVAPRLARLSHVWKNHLLERLTPETQGWGVAGTQSSDYYTPYRETCRELARVVLAAPGISMRDALEQMAGHHYGSDATARSCLMQWGRKGKVAGVEFRDEGRFVKLYPAEAL